MSEEKFSLSDDDRWVNENIFVRENIFVSDDEWRKVLSEEKFWDRM